jgi:hypothetical protein
MPVKFYLHDAATGDTGTLPASNATVSAKTAHQTPSLTNKSMDATIGVLQHSVALTTLANTVDQSTPIARFLSAPIAAQTIAVQTIGYHFAHQQSNTNSNFDSVCVLAVWRPGTGTVVGRLLDSVSTGLLANGGTTSEAAGSNSQFSTAVTSQDGDVLVAELWRAVTIQGMATAYTDTVFYDGTVDDSATDNAAFILFANDVTMFTASSAIPPGLGPVVGEVEPLLSADMVALYA